MGVNKQSARIKHHTVTSTGSFTVPASEDFTDGSWDKWDLLKSELGVNEADDKAYIRIGANIRQIYPQTTAVDVCGIDDGAGGYTYYSSIGAAITAASAGDCIEVFSDILETGTTEINLKDGVNINLNGHTYENSNSGTNNSFTDNAVAVECTIFNGTIKRSGATASVSSATCLHVNSSSSIITLQGVVLSSDFGTACRCDGTIHGGKYYVYLTPKSTNAVCVDVSATGKLYDAFCYNVAGRAISSLGRVHNCTVYSGGDSGIVTNLASAITHSCTAISDGGIGIFANAGSNINCSAYSTANYGIFGGNNTNCTGYSSSSYGIYSSGINIGCSGYSSASYGFYHAGSGLQNCHGYSSANVGLYIAGSSAIVKNSSGVSTAAAAVHCRGSMFNCVAECLWNNVSGHGITGNTDQMDEIFNCTVSVTNASANCLHYGSAINVYYGNNTFKGATTSVNANISQAQTNTPDTYGNIVVG